MKKRTFARGCAKAGLALALALACALAGAAMAAEADAEAVAGAAGGPQEAFMQAALEEAYAGIKAGDGGPFGTGIVKDSRRRTLATAAKMWYNYPSKYDRNKRGEP